MRTRTIVHLLIATLLATLFTALPATAAERGEKERGPSTSNATTDSPASLNTMDRCGDQVTQKLKERANKGDKRGILCRGTQKPRKGSEAEKKQQKALQRLTQDPEPIPNPDWCEENARGKWEWQHRRLACQYRPDDYVRLLKYEKGLPVEKGRMWFIQIDVSVINPVTATWQHQQTLTPFSATGEAATGMTVAGGFSCEGWCSYGAVHFPLQSFTVGNSAQGIRDFTTTVKNRWAVGEIFTRADTTVGKAGYTSAVWSTRAPKVRCDNAVPATTVVGCVFPGFIPIKTYSQSGPFPELAKHIKLAQESGLPGPPHDSDLPGAGVPLHRITDRALADRNGRKACPSHWTRPTSKQCDEYPFRSTREGALTAGSYTPDDPGTPPQSPYPPRTHDAEFCGTFPKTVRVFNPDVHPVDPVGYSVCWINGTQNTKGGNALKNELYTPERVLDRDPFFVRITP